MRRATYRRYGYHLILVISIHALHEESDQYPRKLVAQVGISIHALHEESDFALFRLLCR